MTVATFTATIQQKNRENFYNFFFEGSLSQFFFKKNKWPKTTLYGDFS
jgi:hypothetical protein